jgi:hypothetical protein
LKNLQLEPLKQTCHAEVMDRNKPRTGNESRQLPRLGRGADFNENAQHLVRLSTGQEEPEKPKATKTEISRVMAELGRRGGKIGGKKRAASMTPARRREIALKAARSRWDK